MTCQFCTQIQSEKERIFLENKKYIAIYDKAPVSKGHAIIIPKKHIVSLFEFPKEEIQELYLFLKEAKNLIDSKHRPDGYNIGVNEGKAAGRSVEHIHIHIIPRYTGDVPNPRGGIRNLLGKNIPPAGTN